MRASRTIHGDTEAEAPAAVDLAQLRRQTGDNPVLEREVLGLYLTRCPIDLEKLKSAASPEARSQIAHLMAGSARAVGATAVARLAAMIERRPNSDPQTLVALDRAVEEARRLIVAHLAEQASVR